MKPIKNLLLIFLIGFSLSVAANSFNPRTSGEDKDVGVTKVEKSVPQIVNLAIASTSNEVRSIANVSVINRFTVARTKHKKIVIVKKIYLFNCSIRQCSSGGNSLT